jgi:glycosyltransferase involved in cell wall biosynthesis
VPRFVLDLSERLADDFHVTVLAPHAPGAKRREWIGGLEIVRFRYFIYRWQSLVYGSGILANLKEKPVRALLIPFFFIAEIFATFRLLRQYDIKILHAHWIVPQGISAVLARFFAGKKCPILCTSHGSDLSESRGPLFQKTVKWALRRFDVLAVVSNAMRTRAIELGINPHDIHVLPMGITPDLQMNNCANTRKGLLYVGRLIKQKGLQYLLQALPAVLQKYPDMVLDIIGAGADEAVFVDLAERIGIENHVRFVGALAHEDVMARYWKASVVVMPSLSEGLGLVAAEALASKCPVVASDLPAVRDIVVDGETGLLFKAGDYRDMASKILRLLDDEQLGALLAENGQLWVSKRYDWDIAAGGYRSLIESLASGKNQRIFSEIQS